MKKESTVNTFQEGMIMDLNPIITPNSAMTNCLNGTIVTFNGNENVLQNDMGNGRVETAYLPEGYVPLGTTEFGGIIYIVSYNPLIDKCQIGCFPSPERNITSDEIAKNPKKTITESVFKNEKEEITTTEYKLQLLKENFKLSPGDKYSIYSTNKGIENNFDNLSFIGNTQHKFEDIYKNVEIHVISISDDGKIIYLDNSVKWYKKTKTEIEPETGTKKDKVMDYYIRDVDKVENISTDIDSYRTLVNTAYNIFSSKASGKLALLFKLNVINTFSVTWELESLEKNEKNESKVDAKLAFDINYTSDHTSINPEEIVSEISTSKNVNYIQQGQQGQKDPSVDKITHLPIETPTDRKNDGSDPSIKVPIGIYENSANPQYGTFSYITKDNTAIINYTLKPAMKFGILPYLSQKGSIDLTKIGTGSIDLKGWKYYVNSYKRVTINLQLDAYPRLGDTIEGIYIIFYHPDELDTLESWEYRKYNKYQYIPKKKEEDADKSYKTITITTKGGYSGIHQTAFHLDENVPEDHLFLVDVCIQLLPKAEKSKESPEYTFYHNVRFMYTNSIFNNEYYNTEVKDFKDLTIGDYLKPTVVINKTSDTLDNTTKRYPNISGILSEMPEEGAYAGGTMSAQETIIDGEIKFKYKILDQGYKNLIEYSPFNISLKEHSIEYQNDTPIADTKKDEKTDLVKPVCVISEKPDLWESTLLIPDQKNNDLYYDYFYCYIDGDTIKVEGNLYSRINATLEKEEVTSNKQLRPVLYSTADLEPLGLANYNGNIGFNNVFVMESGDHGKGNDFKLTMMHYSINGSDTFPLGYAPDNHTYYNYLGKYVTADGIFNGDGGFTRNWTEIPEFKSIGESMKLTNNLFAYWQFGWRNESKHYMEWEDSRRYQNSYEGRGAHLAYANLIMVRGTDNFIPQSLFLPNDNKKATPTQTVSGITTFNKVMTALFTQLYYVQENSASTTMPRVTNINYLTDYNVILTIPIKFSVSNIQVKTKNGWYRLSTSQPGVGASKYPNLHVKYIYPTSSISHNFYIRNDELYNKYSSYKLLVAPCIAKTAYGDYVTNVTALNQLYVPAKLHPASGSPESFTAEFTKITDRYLTVNTDIEVSDDLIKMKYTQGKWESVTNNLCKNLRIKNGQLYVDKTGILKDPAVLRTTEYSKKSTDFNITFNGNISSLIYHSQYS